MNTTSVGHAYILQRTSSRRTNPFRQVRRTVTKNLISRHMTGTLSAKIIPQKGLIAHRQGYAGRHHHQQLNIRIRLSRRMIATIKSRSSPSQHKQIHTPVRHRSQTLSHSLSSTRTVGGNTAHIMQLSGTIKGPIRHTPRIVRRNHVNTPDHTSKKPHRAGSY